MKKYIIIILFLSIGRINSQERVNRKDISFISESQVIENVTGWSYNNTSGDWILHKNCISIKNGGKVYVQSTSDQNFNNLQFKEVKYDSQIYYALIIPKLDYSYQYPNIQVGFYTYKLVDIYIFPEIEYNKIKSFEDKIDIGTRMRANIRENIKNIKEQDLLDKIQSTIIADLNRSEVDKKYRNEFTYILPIKKVQIKEKTMMRFFLPSFYHDFEATSYSKPKLDFDKEYFEVDEIEFKKFIIN